MYVSHLKIYTCKIEKFVMDRAILKSYICKTCFSCCNSKLKEVLNRDAEETFALLLSNNIDLQLSEDRTEITEEDGQLKFLSEIPNKN